MRFSAWFCIAVLVPALVVLPEPVQAGDTVALGSAFHYQAQLKLNGAPVTDVCHFRFGLWTNPDFQSGFLGQVDVDGVQVENGLVDLDVDFGFEAFDGADRWLEVAVACPGGATFFSYTTLEPRQRIAATPYALQTRGLHVNDAGDVGIGIVGSTQRLTVERSSGRVGVNTESPLTRLHVVDDSLGLTSDAIRDDDLVIEDGDAVLGLYSNAGGSAGSTISLKELVAGVMTDNWSIWRGSGNGDSALHFSYGPDPVSSSNPDIMTMAPTGRVGVGTTTPSADLHVRGDTGLLVDDGAGEAVLSANGPGRVGVGTASPAAKFNVESDADLIEGPVTHHDDIVVESVDAVLGLYSDETGTAGSAISLKEIHPQGPLTDHWAMYRETNQAGAALHFSYGSSVNYASNPTIVEMSDDTGVRIEGDLHVDGAVTATEAQTRYLSIPAVAFALLSAEPCCFEPQYFPAQFDTDGLAVAHSSGFRPAGHSFRFGAPVQLPDGARIVEFRVFAFDDAPDENLVVRLVRNRLSDNGPATVALAKSSGTPGEVVLKKALSPGEAVDNSKFAYWIRVEWTSPGDGNGRIFFGPGRVTYTSVFP